LAELRFSLVTERAKQRCEVRTQIEIAFSNLKRVFGLIPIHFISGTMKSCHR